MPLSCCFKYFRLKTELAVNYFNNVFICLLFMFIELTQINFEIEPSNSFFGRQHSQRFADVELFGLRASSVSACILLTKMNLTKCNTIIAVESPSIQTLLY